MLKALFTSNTRLKLLDHFFNHPFRSFYLRELQRTLDESLTPLRRELGKMEQIGLLQSRREGNQKFYALNREFIIYPELQNIFTKMRYPAEAKTGRQPRSWPNSARTGVSVSQSPPTKVR